MIPAFSISGGAGALLVLFLLLGGILAGWRLLCARRPVDSLWMQGIWRFLAVYPLTWLASGVAYGCCVWAGWEWVQQDVFDQLLAGSIWRRIGIAFSAVVWMPVLEELIFREFLQTLTLRYLGRVAGLLLPAILFVALHGSWSAATALGVLAMALALARLRTGSILPCILMHGLYNACTLLLFLLFSFALET